MTGVVQPISVRMVVVVANLSQDINAHASLDSLEPTVGLVSSLTDITKLS